MTEKELAYNISRIHAQSIVDSNGRGTMNGMTLGKKYAEWLYKAGGYNAMAIADAEMALCHWVSSVGYDQNGKFQIIISEFIQNS